MNPLPPRARFRCVLDPEPSSNGVVTPVQAFFPTIEAVRVWAFGSKAGGIERPRGVLEAASAGSVVKVFREVEEQVAVMRMEEGGAESVTLMVKKPADGTTGTAEFEEAR